MTKYAEKILDIVEHSDCHMTAEQVFDRLRRDFPRVALATVYNNLNHLIQYGLVVVATIPILCAFPFFQKYIEKGAVLGGVKE